MDRQPQTDTAVFVCRSRRRATILSFRTIRRPNLCAYAHRSALKCASRPSVRPPILTSLATRSDLACPWLSFPCHRPEPGAAHDPPAMPCYAVIRRIGGPPTRARLGPGPALTTVVLGGQLVRIFGAGHKADDAEVRPAGADAAQVMARRFTCITGSRPATQSLTRGA